MENIRTYISKFREAINFWLFGRNDFTLNFLNKIITWSADTDDNVSRWLSYTLLHLCHDLVKKRTCFVSVLNDINQIWIIVINQVIFVFDFYIIGKNTSCRLFWYTLLVFYWIISWKKSTILIRSRTLKFLSFRYWNIISF